MMPTQSLEKAVETRIKACVDRLHRELQQHQQEKSVSSDLDLYWKKIFSVLACTGFPQFFKPEEKCLVKTPYANTTMAQTIKTLERFCNTSTLFEQSKMKKGLQPFKPSEQSEIVFCKEIANTAQKAVYNYLRSNKMLCYFSQQLLEPHLSSIDSSEKENFIPRSD